ncbi:methyltransferase domain-containing protein [Halorarum halophilum]|uniref:Methyltransferase domain-containing protein n=1 Tax=Halorarum halophilum TaxID=2743090 RepID=A0A7D5GKH1_9EURY|nr:METTL5 family protein [Halobaculum halophilum]QLG27484.1 methyltransferase domain-containing protein [Halobaculum halophilum]
MSKRALEGKLAVVAGFTDPTAALEQYPTPPDLAAHIVHLADLRGDVAGHTVVDLGAGTGMFALGAALRGAARVVGLELDRDALAVARANERRVGARTPIHWVNADATRAPLCFGEPDAATPDAITVLMNPPFGAQSGNEHADRRFLETVASFADVSYSLHNAGSEEFVESFVDDAGGEVTDAFRATFALDRQFDHQTAERRELDAEAYRIEWD